MNLEWPFAFFPGLFLALLLGQLYRRSKYPKIPADRILHEEKWQSGNSYGLSFRGCLHLWFLKDRLVLRPHFPFDIPLPAIVALPKEIAYSSIRSCMAKRMFWVSWIELVYNEVSGPRRLLLTAKDQEKAKALLRSSLREY